MPVFLILWDLKRLIDWSKKLFSYYHYVYTVYNNVIKIFPHTCNYAYLVRNINGIFLCRKSITSEQALIIQNICFYLSQMITLSRVLKLWRHLVWPKFLKLTMMEIPSNFRLLYHFPIQNVMLIEKIKQIIWMYLLWRVQFCCNSINSKCSKIYWYWWLCQIFL